MKGKRILLCLIFIMSFFTFNLKSSALTLPYLAVTSNNYSVGDKITLEEISSIQIGNTLQLYAIIQ